ncbi:MAG: electron transfer flavoprotein subunit beta/FixA family protein [Cellulomonadaceae bacterium]|nr:electron transfer flavoprotein subunit beta/FixA family protein [Cellulomonadaceae bacterium]
MRIVVLLKYVPDLTSERRFADGRAVREAAEGVLNEIDENAVEAALQLIEALPDEADRQASEVIAVTMAPEGGDLAVKKAFQLGAGRGIRLADEALVGSDYFGTTAALAATIRRLGEDAPIDAVIAGMTALDGLGSVVPALLAEELGWPQLTHATAVELSADALALTITRETDDVVARLSAPLPAVVSVSDAANTPRLANFKLIMAARKQPVEQWTVADIEPFFEESAVAGADCLGVAGARASIVETAQRPPRPDVNVVKDAGDGQVAAAAIVDYLKGHDLV